MARTPSSADAAATRGRTGHPAVRAYRGRGWRSRIPRGLQHGLEGIVAKRRDSRYHSGRCRDWIKIKNMAHPAIERAMPMPLKRPQMTQDSFSSPRALGSSRRSKRVQGLPRASWESFADPRWRRAPFIHRPSMVSGRLRRAASGGRKLSDRYESRADQSPLARQKRDKQQLVYEPGPRSPQR
jgi:hypothetical protein